jgi:hypothetical protein
MRMMHRMAWCVLLLPLLCGADVGPDRQERLKELDPEFAQGYIELAESIADDVEDDQQRRLAIRLFALGATLDPERWGRSGMLGILPLLDDDEQIRSVQSMLELQDGRGSGMLPRRRVLLGSQSKAQIAAFDVLSSIRSGDIKSGKVLLRSVGGTRELLEEYEDEIPGGMQRLLDRVKTAEDGQRYALSNSEYVAHLQVQSHLLGGARETWSATLSAWNGRPLEDVSKADLGPVLELDLTKSVWRGNWTEP